MSVREAGTERCQNLSDPASLVLISGSCTTFLATLERSAAWKVQKTVLKLTAGIKTAKPFTAILNKGKSDFSSFSYQIRVFKIPLQTMWLYHSTPSSHVHAMDLNICVLAGGQYRTGKTELMIIFSLLQREGSWSRSSPWASICSSLLWDLLPTGISKSWTYQSCLYVLPCNNCRRQTLMSVRTLKHWKELSWSLKIYKCLQI